MIQDLSKYQKVRDQLLPQQSFGGLVFATTHSLLLGFLWYMDTPCQI